MLSGFDDYPIHQTSMPVAHAATGDLNHYDRYFFNGYARVWWRPGTRWAASFEYDLIEHGGARHTVRMTPRFEFAMRGLGYGHPEFGHGLWKGESATAGERLELPVADPLTRDNVHVQALCDATLTMADGTTEQGLGVLEQMCIGPHPSGLHGALDGYSVDAQ